MKKISLLANLIVLFSSSFVFAQQKLDFDSIKQNREAYSAKEIQIEGRVQDLKVIKQDRKSFATFFISDGIHPETISVKVDLSAGKKVTNEFNCKEGEFTTIQGPFKPWGKATYLGKIEVKDHYEFKCTAAGHAFVKSVPEKKVIASTEGASDAPVIINQGGDGVRIYDSNGKRVMKSDAKLDAGSTIKTGSRGFVQLKYPDGTQVAVGQASRVKIEPSSAATQQVELKVGRLHALVHKAESGQIHFKVKTRTATMGVRGTEFFVEGNREGKVSTHVIEGKVDVAKDEASLLSGDVKKVKQNEFVEADEKGVSETQKFDSKAYLASVSSEEAQELVSLEPEKGAEVANSTPTPKPVLAKSSDSAKNKSPQWFNFRLAGLAYVSKNANPAFTGMISWNPEFRLGRAWSLGLDAGYTNIKNSNYGSRFSAIEGAVVMIYSFTSRMATELKVGMQNWMSPVSSAGAMGGLAFRYNFCDRCMIRSLIIGDDVLSVKSQTYQVPRLGLAFGF